VEPFFASIPGTLSRHAFASGIPVSNPGYGDERLRRLLLRRLYEEKIKFEQMIPSEYRRLDELLEDPDPGVRLVSGEWYRFSNDDLKRLADDLPWYLRGLVKLPWVFRYQRTGFRSIYRLVGPDRWAARALHYLYEGDIGGELWEVEAWRFTRLLRRYKSLILVVLNIELSG
jgi:hypothetical protein